MFPNRTEKANRYIFKQIRGEKIRCYLWNTEKNSTNICFTYNFSRTYFF